MAIPKSNDTSVEYKAWMPVDGGGSETIGITLPVGATADMLTEAVRQWQLMREKALPALREAVTAAQIQTQVEASLPIHEIKLPFGKYKGCTLGYIYESDKGYLEWMAYKADPERTEKVWRDRAKEMVEHPPEASFSAPNDITPEDIPF